MHSEGPVLGQPAEHLSYSLLQLWEHESAEKAGAVNRPSIIIKQRRGCKNFMFLLEKYF